MLATQYQNVYVASVALGADPAQYIKALREAEAHDGPSLIVAYAPCINHGIVKGMAWAQEEAKLAVKSGYWVLYRYDPKLKAQGKNPFTLDFKEPKYDLREFFMGEVRFNSLQRTFPEAAEALCRCLGAKKRGGAAELAARLEKKRMTREDLAAMLEGCRDAFSAALLSLYGQAPEGNLRETASFLAKNLTKSQIVRTIEVLQKYRGECAYNVGPGHVLGALAVELEDIF